jgi:hypothetical protein
VTRRERSEIADDLARRARCPKAGALSSEIGQAIHDGRLGPHEAAAIAWLAELGRAIERGRDISELDEVEGRLLLARWLTHEHARRAVRGKTWDWER